MNASRLIHLCDVKRESVTVGSGTTDLGGYATAVSNVPCLLEPMKAWTQKTLMGEVSGVCWHFSWGGQVLQEGDLVVNVRDKFGVALFPGRTFAFKQDVQDTLRPAWSSVFRFQTGRLEEEIAETT